MASNSLPWLLDRGQGPLLATAIHAGHDMRDELLPWVRLTDEERLREEDPYTDRWTAVAPNQLIMTRSRFEVDLNRERAAAVYRRPEDAWGLQVWTEEFPPELAERSLAIYDEFYTEVQSLLSRMVRRYGRVVILDLHSYNHRRDGSDAPPADSDGNPEINVGTGTMIRDRWANVVDRFIADLRDFNFLGRRLDVRENVKFRGGFFAKWIHSRFPENVCVLSVEVKKFFMDEWTGREDASRIATVGRALQSTVWGIYEELARLGAREPELRT